MMNDLNIALTMGDPASISPEIILKTLANSTIQKNCKITVIGSYFVLKKTYQYLNSIGIKNLAHPDDFSIIDLDNISNFNFGQGDAFTGASSFEYLHTAIDLTLKGQFSAIATAPISKSLWHLAGYNYPGQTEVLAHQTEVKDFAMMFIGRSPYTNWILRSILATTHIPLNQVSSALTPELMTKKLTLLLNFLRDYNDIGKPHVAIAGLNPHSGEDGKLGQEEKIWLNNWLQQARKNNPDVTLTGLIPPDTMWVKAGQAWFINGQISTPTAYMALYHDQGLIPVKLMAFEQAINTTIGLPFIRTSPDHGTAFDIAGKGVANPNSMIEAIKLAVDLTCKKFDKS